MRGIGKEGEKEVLLLAAAALFSWGKSILQERKVQNVGVSAWNRGPTRDKMRSTKLEPSDQDQAHRTSRPARAEPGRQGPSGLLLPLISHAEAPGC